MYKFSDTPPYLENFEEAGFGDSVQIKNLGTFYIVILLYVFYIVFIFLVVWLLKKYSTKL